MATKLGNIVVELQANVSKFSQGMSKAASKAKAAGKQISAGLGKAKIAVAALGVAALALAKNTANVGDQMLKLSEQTGITVERISALKFAAEQSDTSMEALSKGILLLARNLSGLTEGSKSIAILEQLGVATKNVSGEMRAADDILLDIAGVFERLPNGMEKSAIAMELFGKSGADLIPFLSQGAHGIAILEKQAARLGVTFSTKSARAASEFNDALGVMGSAVRGVGFSIGNIIIPPLTKLFVVLSPISDIFRL